MPAGFRGVIVALARLALVGATPFYGQESKADQAPSGREGQRQLERIASAVEKLPNAQSSLCEFPRDRIFAPFPTGFWVVGAHGASIWNVEGIGWQITRDDQPFLFWFSLGVWLLVATVGAFITVLTLAG